MLRIKPFSFQSITSRWRTPVKQVFQNGFLIILLSVLVNGQTNANGAAKVNDWRSDIDSIVNDIRLLHPDPFTKIGKSAFLRQAAALKDAVPLLSEEQRVVRLMQLVASIGDGHTILEPNSAAFASWYPVRMYAFSDGYFVTSAHKSVMDLAGTEVLEIAGRPVAEAMTEARSLIGADNEFARKERLWAIHNAGLMKGLGYAAPNGEMKVKFRLRDGKIVERKLQPSLADNPRYKGLESRFEWQFRTEMYGLPFGADADWISAYKGLPSSAFQTPDLARPPHLTDRLRYSARPLPESDAFYIRTNFVTDTDFIPFFQNAMKEVDQQKPRRLILDWRFNFGGDGSKMYLVIQEFIKRADHRPWQELYILTGQKTFSAAIMAIDAFIDNVPLTVVGEPSPAGLNHFGDPTARTYHRTGVFLNVSTLRHQMSSSDDLSEYIPVDVPAPFSFADYAAGRDPAVDPILRGDDMRSIPVIARQDGGAIARRVYLERKAKFSKYDWWLPPKEYDLRQACDTLRDQKRMTEALETCQLNAEIHPYIWNVWYNLGLTQRAAGLQKERLASYRCVIEIAPDNWNVPGLRQLMAQPGNEGNELAPGCPAGDGKAKPEETTTTGGQKVSYNPSKEEFKPAVVRFGATVAETEKALTGLCKKITTHRINPPFLVLREDVKDKQMQIDCDGLPYFGKPRWAEFVFADDSLEMVWILTETGDEQTLLKAMTDASGEVTHRNQKFTAAVKGRAALRTDRPEVLFYSEKLAPRVLPWFGENSTFR